MWHIEYTKSCGGREKYDTLGSGGPERKEVMGMWRIEKETGEQGTGVNTQSLRVR
jgi:hypothetical protein